MLDWFDWYDPCDSQVAAEFQPGEGVRLDRRDPAVLQPEIRGGHVGERLRADPLQIDALHQDVPEDVKRATDRDAPRVAVTLRRTRANPQRNALDSNTTMDFKTRIYICRTYY